MREIICAGRRVVVALNHASVAISSWLITLSSQREPRAFPLEPFFWRQIEFAPFAVRVVWWIPWRPRRRRWLTWAPVPVHAVAIDKVGILRFLPHWEHLWHRAWRHRLYWAATICECQLSQGIDPACVLLSLGKLYAIPCNMALRSASEAEEVLANTRARYIPRRPHIHPP